MCVYVQINEYIYMFMIYICMYTTYINMHISIPYTSIIYQINQSLKKHMKHYSMHTVADAQEPIAQQCKWK